jgi:hypothetical protein
MRGVKFITFLRWRSRFLPQRKTVVASKLCLLLVDVISSLSCWWEPLPEASGVE